MANVRSQPEQLKLKQSLTIITQNAAHSNIMYVYRGHSASTSLGKGEEVDKESKKKMTLKGECAAKIDVPHTTSSMYFFL